MKFVYERNAAQPVAGANALRWPFRCRNSRRSSAVVQLSTLGSITFMDQDTFTKVVATLHQLAGSAGEIAAFVIVPLMLAGIVCGFLLTRWIFRGGLSRSEFRLRD
jgi:hypothetical protein